MSMRGYAPNVIFILSIDVRESGDRLMPGHDQKIRLTVS